jgi:hypothetical protein
MVTFLTPCFAVSEVTASFIHLQTSEAQVYVKKRNLLFSAGAQTHGRQVFFH